MSVVIANQLSKGYRQYRHPVDSLKELIFRRPYHTTVHALENVSFELAPGEVLGVIGDNGAGKSTLLKLLAGTLRPSGGHLQVNGRVSAILELGSGFHPEFSGIENVRIGCAMQGLGAAEIERLIPEIVAFSELGEAVHRPVKTYSSGMYVRLAFAVVTSVDPGVLVIDEALSVGDQQFQKKSLDRIRSFIDQERTVVFCSHNLYQVKSLCSRVLWLHEGRQRLLGSPEEVVERYMDYSREKSASSSSVDVRHEATEVSGADATIAEVDLEGHDGAYLFATGDDLVLKMRVDAPRLAATDLSMAVVMMRNDNIHVYATSTEIEGVTLHPVGEGSYSLSMLLPDLQLLSGKFVFYLYLMDAEGLHIYDKRESVLPFTVRHQTREVGVSRLMHEWSR